ncbi:MAG: MGMT family protein [Gammaproteobacteria bacterium]|nr:MAG: MGMT family protein [Gammaproteobacteria bacterium]
MSSGLYRRFYRIIAQIPLGRVVTYGQVAELAGAPRAARQVGYALAATPAGLDIPWHRVVNARGEISRRADPDDMLRQRLLLEAEGVWFDENGRISLERYGWSGR